MDTSKQISSLFGVLPPQSQPGSPFAPKLHQAAAATGFSVYC